MPIAVSRTDPWRGRGYSWNAPRRRRLPWQMKITPSLASQELDALVEKTYGRPYCFQQQDGCQMRGVHHIVVPAEPEDYEATSVREIVNGDEMGVAFAAWLARDPEAHIGGRSDEYVTDLWWSRNFYPHQSMVLNDLHARGLLDAGEYLLVIDW
jgi:hypothetical protein